MPQELPEVESFQLEVPNPDLAAFSSIEVTKVNEELPWKPPIEVSVNYPDGTSNEGVDAATPAFIFKGERGSTLTVSIAAAGHIDALHIRGTEPGSRFGYDSLNDMFADIAPKIPVEVAQSPAETSAFSIETGKPMGKEGIATMGELVEDGHLTEADVAAAKSLEDGVTELNLRGSDAEKAEFIEHYADEHPDAKVQFQLVRGKVIVPAVQAPKRDTTELFMVFGPDGKGGKTMYTAAPGRNMPKHPDPKQHMDSSGVVNPDTFNESSRAWFDTVMLTGE